MYKDVSFPLSIMYLPQDIVSLILDQADLSIDTRLVLGIGSRKLQVPANVKQLITDALQRVCAVFEDDGRPNVNVHLGVYGTREFMGSELIESRYMLFYCERKHSYDRGMRYKSSGLGHKYYDGFTGQCNYTSPDYSEKAQE